MREYQMDQKSVLERHGWKTLSDNYLKSFKKDQLVEVIRCLEHNWYGSLWESSLLQHRLEKVCGFLGEKNYSTKEINRIISVEGENQGYERDTIQTKCS
ncbi:MAG: hypothetical protein J6T15_05275 [Bacilli bacterium]|nr:hypothetical protein [Bacilli bacterium]